MTPIEQLAKEFSKGNPATEAAFLAGAKQARLQDIEVLECDHDVFVRNGYRSKSAGIHRAIILLKELL